MPGDCSWRSRPTGRRAETTPRRDPSRPRRASRTPAEARRSTTMHTPPPGLPRCSARAGAQAPDAR